MKFGIVSARHGSYDNAHDLNENGKGQIRALAQSIKKQLDGQNFDVFLVSSTAPRAQHSSEIIAKVLQIPESKIYFNQNLWSDATQGGSIQEAKKLTDEAIQEGRFTIFVSHVDMAPIIANHVIGELRLKAQAVALACGQGMFITDNSFSLIP